MTNKQLDPLVDELANDVANLCTELRLQKLPTEDGDIRDRAADMLRFLHDRVEALARAKFTPDQSELAYKQDAARRKAAITIDRLTTALTHIAEGNERPGHCTAITKERMASIARDALSHGDTKDDRAA